jgi:peptidylprolyl isomerase
VQSLSGLVEGWQQALVGKTVGSRVVLAIPPRLGYGAEGNEGAGIRGTDTIYFVIDILGRAPEPVAPEPAEEESPSASPSAEVSPTDDATPSPAVSESPTDEES